MLHPVRVKNWRHEPWGGVKESISVTTDSPENWRLYNYERCRCIDIFVIWVCVCRNSLQVKVFLYEMASIGMRSKTAQRYVDAVSLQYKLPQAAKNGLQVCESTHTCLLALVP